MIVRRVTLLCYITKLIAGQYEMSSTTQKVSGHDENNLTSQMITRCHYLMTNLHPGLNNPFTTTPPGRLFRTALFRQVSLILHHCHMKDRNLSCGNNYLYVRN